MTPEKCEALMQGKSTVARKVYECVPANESWPKHQIISELKRRTGSQVDVRIAQGCLNDLSDSGLIKVVKQSGIELFRRVSVSSKPVAAPVPATIKTSQKTEESSMPAVKEVKAAPAASPIEILGELAGEISTLATDVNQRLKKIAGRIEEAALTIEQQRETDAAGMEKLRQLQNLLKGL